MMASLDPLAVESSPQDYESELNLSTSSSLPESPKTEKTRKTGNLEGKTLIGIKRNIGKHLQLISAEKEKIAQLKEECVRLESKAEKLNLVAGELQEARVKPGHYSELIKAAKKTSVRLMDEITELKTLISDFPALRQSMNETKQQLAYLNGTSLDGLSLSEYRRLFAEKCQAIERINSVVVEKAVSQAERDLCIVCVTAGRSVVLVPCGHLVLCTDCSHCVQVCPVCRATIQERFLSG